jgi:hypothetical protein
MSTKFFILTLITLFLFSAAATAARAQTPDQIRGMIEAEARARDLGEQIVPIAEQTSTTTGTHVWSGSYDRGVVIYEPHNGVVAIKDPILRWYYLQLHHSVGNSPLGWPITDELQCSTPDPRVRYQLFERGTFFLSVLNNREYGYASLGRPATVGNCVIPGPMATVVTEPPASTGERFRVSIVGFTVNRQTNDGLQELDGKGDEVYVVAQVAQFQNNGQLASNTLERSVLMGDTDLRPANEERMSTGNLSDQGGIGDGFRYRPLRNPSVRYSHPTLPWVVYEGRLAPNANAVMIIPTIWEWDSNDRTLQEYRELYFSGSHPPYFYGSPPRRRWGDNAVASPASTNPWVANLVRDSLRSSTGFTPSRGWGTGPVINSTGSSVGLSRDGDQPIGLSNAPTGSEYGRYGYRLFAPQILFLTYRLAQTVVTQTYPVPVVRASGGSTAVTAEPFGALGPGIVPIRYAGTDEGTGDYTIFLKVERIP